VARREASTRTRLLLGCAAVAGPLFVTTFLVEGARRADYDPLRHPVSTLSLGPRGAVQVANFAATGMLYLAGAAGLSRLPRHRGGGRLGAAILGATGVGLIGSALFNTAAVSGYPPEALNAPTTAMTMHSLSAVPIFFGVPAGSFAYSWRFLRSGKPAWALYSAASGISMLVSMGMAGAGFSQSPRFVRLAGLSQRVAIISGLGWLTALCLRALR
jgi:uncharacterized protein DUF998